MSPFRDEVLTEPTILPPSVLYIEEFVPTTFVKSALHMPLTWEMSKSDRSSSAYSNFGSYLEDGLVSLRGRLVAVIMPFAETLMNHSVCLCDVAQLLDAQASSTQITASSSVSRP